MKAKQNHLSVQARERRRRATKGSQSRQQRPVGRGRRLRPVAAGAPASRGRTVTCARPAGTGRPWGGPTSSGGSACRGHAQLHHSKGHTLVALVAYYQSLKHLPSFFDRDLVKKYTKGY